MIIKLPHVTGWDGHWKAYVQISTEHKSWLHYVGIFPDREEAHAAAAAKAAEK